METCKDLARLLLKRHETTEQLARLSNFDDLTGLPNLTQLKNTLDSILAKDEPVAAVLFADLDSFKDVNDALGFASGDKLLIEVAKAIKAIVQPDDMVSRMSADDFVILLSGKEAERASLTAEKILRRMKEPFLLDGTPIFLSASIGISVYPMDGQDADTLLKSADSARYQAKANGKNQLQFHNQDMASLVKERLEMADALRNALKENQLRLMYQPQIDSQTNTLYGVEALCRWNHPAMGNIPPSKFIVLAEEIGLIAEITFWALEVACHQMAQWRANGVHVPAVSVNLAPTVLRDSSLPSFIEGLLNKYELSKQSLTIEITERDMVDDNPQTLATIAQIHALGIGISMDDFGTGFSSLSKLVSLPITELKIDANFMRNLLTDKTAQAVVRAVVRIGQSMNVAVVAEGVETQEEFRFLADIHCQVIQGYYFSKPLEAKELGVWLASRSGGIGTQLAS